MNYQNIPRGDKVVKRAFVPKLDAFLFADYSQIELRLLAYYMALLGDHSMVDAFKAGKDMHTESAMAALKVYRELDDEERQVGKTLNYSVIYGGGTPTLMRQRGIDYLEAREILDNYHERWPGIRMVQNSIQARLNERGYITTIYGRHLHPESDHKALNALCQGSAAELLRKAAIEVDARLKRWGAESHIVNLIHDEIMLDVVRAEIPDIAAVVPVLMRDERIHEVVPIEVDLEVSFTTWADKQPFGKELLASAA